MPKRTIFYFVSANERGATLTCSVLPVVARVPSLLTVNSVMELDCSLMTKTNFASGSTRMDSGFVPVPATEDVNAVSAPVVVSTLNCDRFADAEFTTYTNAPVVSVAAATGEVPVTNSPGPESRLPSDRISKTVTVFRDGFGTYKNFPAGSIPKRPTPPLT